MGALALHRIGFAARVYEAYPHGAEQVGSFLMTASPRCRYPARTRASWRLGSVYLDGRGEGHLHCLASSEGALDDAAGTFQLPVHDLAPLPRWHRGGMVLVGDSAHVTSPSSGQGASLAVEDAVILAQCLRDLPDHVTAFERYQQLRWQRVKRSSTAPRG